MKRIMYLTGNIRILGLTPLTRFYNSLRLWYYEDKVQIAFCYYKMPRSLHDHNMKVIIGTK